MDIAKAEEQGHVVKAIDLYDYVILSEKVPCSNICSRGESCWCPSDTYGHVLHEQAPSLSWEENDSCELYAWCCLGGLVLATC